MQFHLITLFPESFESYINSSIIGRAIEDKKIKVNYYNPRDFTKDKQRRIDQKPYGGGPGMIIEALPVIKAVQSALVNAKRKTKNTNKILTVWLSPSGKQFDNEQAEKFSKKYEHIIIICGRYEGIDERVNKVFKTNKISVGPYITTGGELPAMILIDVISRRIPSVIGKIESLEENRNASSVVYTRPEVLEYRDKRYKLPKVLLSGNHKKIDEWRIKQKHQT